MNIDNLIKELQQIDIEKLTDNELEELLKNIEKTNSKGSSCNYCEIFSRGRFS